MARNLEEYAVGIIQNNGTIKYITELGEHHTAYWEDGKEAMYFSKAHAKDLVEGMAYNYIAAVAILKSHFVTLKNPIEN